MKNSLSKILKPQTKEQLGKYYKVALTTADFAIEYTRKTIKQIQAIDWQSYFHPTVYSTEGIERLASVGLDLFIAFCITLFPLAGWAVAIAYILLRDSLPFLQGQSLGKHFFGLRVVRQQNLKPLTKFYKRSIIRGGVLLVPFLNFYDMYRYFTTGQRIADEWAQTLVIKERYNVQDTTGKDT
jgi:hypothetical protein